MCNERRNYFSLQLFWIKLIWHKNLCRVLSEYCCTILGLEATILKIFFHLQVEYVVKLIRVAGVAAVPGCGFFHTREKLSRKESSQSISGPVSRPESIGRCEGFHTLKDYRDRYIRFSYCKSKATLMAATEKLNKYNGSLILHDI